MKKAEKPSFLMSSRMTVMPPTLLSKFWFWIRVLMTSSGCEIAIDETCELQNSGQPWRPAGNRAKRGDTYGSGNGSDKVLVPRRRSVVFKTEDVLLRERRTTKELCGDSLRCQCIGYAPPRGPIPDTHSERAGRIPGGGPGRSAVESEALIPHNLHESTRPERLRVGPATPSVSAPRASPVPLGNKTHCRLILRTSRGSRTISPMPVKLHPGNRCEVSTCSKARKGEAGSGRTIQPWPTSSPFRSSRRTRW